MKEIVSCKVKMISKIVLLVIAILSLISLKPEPAMAAT